MYRILLICETNFCLSPLAGVILEAMILEQGLAKQIAVGTAGAFAGKEPRPAERRTADLARSKGLSLDHHRTRQVAAEDVREASLVIALSQDSYWHIHELRGSSDEPPLKTLAQFAEDLALGDISDPVLGDSEFDATFTLLHTLCQAVFESVLMSLELNKR